MIEEVYIKKPLTTRRIVEILDSNPNLKIIKCPPSLYKRTPRKYLDALNQLGVEVESYKKLGRPKKYGKEEVEKINQMIEDGFSMAEISGKLDIPLKTVYYLKSKPLPKGRKKKYDDETVEKVAMLSRKGVRPNEISRKLHIPLRSVYSLINR
jgi:hypothetical protein